MHEMGARDSLCFLVMERLLQHMVFHHIVCTSHSCSSLYVTGQNLERPKPRPKTDTKHKLKVEYTKAITINTTFATKRQNCQGRQDHKVHMPRKKDESGDWQRRGPEGGRLATNLT